MAEWVSKLSVGRYEKELETAVELALRCGKAIDETQGARVEWKDGEDCGIDPCTATDMANEQLVSEVLRERCMLPRFYRPNCFWAACLSGVRPLQCDSHEQSPHG